MPNSPDSSVDIATRCVLEGPWIESLKGGRDMPLQSKLTLRPIVLRWVLGHFPRGTAARAWRWPPTSSTAEAKERAELLSSEINTFWSTFGSGWIFKGNNKTLSEYSAWIAFSSCGQCVNPMDIHTSFVRNIFSFEMRYCLANLVQFWLKNGRKYCFHTTNRYKSEITQ